MIYDKRWYEYFFDLAERSAKQSKDPNTQHGSVIVRHKHIVSIGFNGFPSRIRDDAELLADREKKLMFMVHAEANAIDNSGDTDLRTCDIFVTGAPCSGCALRIVEAGIGTVHYRVDGRDDFAQRWAAETEKSLEIFDRAHVIVRKYNLTTGEIVDVPAGKYLNLKKAATK